MQSVDVRNGRLDAGIAVENLGGHKLPTAYPSRRAWLHVTVRDRNGRAVFESGALNARRLHSEATTTTRTAPASSRITPRSRVPIRCRFTRASWLGADGAVTTGLLTAVRYVKDNRLLPHGFDKRTADKDVAVHGDAEGDADFAGGGRSDRVLGGRGRRARGRSR